MDWYVRRIRSIEELSRAGADRSEDLIQRLEQAWRVTGDAHAPLYRRLHRVLRDAIDKQVLAPHEALPAERDLAEALKISRITVRKALRDLADEGLVVRVQGAGTFVAPRYDTGSAKLTCFNEDMRARGLEPSDIWLGRSEGEATPSESLALGLSPGEPVFRFSRIRCADGSPVALEYTTAPAFALPSVDSVEESLYESLGSVGHRPVRALQRLRAVAFTPEQARLLKTADNHCGLLIERRSFLRDGRSVEVTQSYYRGDAYDFVAELNSLP
jgi:GntR family transcriptional regulator